MDESQERIIFGAIVSYASLAVNVLLGIAYIPWMIHSIGIANYGLYTLAISIIGFFALDFGLSEAVTRFVSKCNAEGDASGASNVLGLIYKLYLFLTGVFGVALVTAYFFIEDLYLKLTPNELEVFKGLYIVAAVYSLISFPLIPINGILISYERFVALKLCDLGQKLVTVGLVILALHLGYGVFALVTANAVAGLGAMVVKLYLVRRLPVSIVFRVRNQDLLIDILRFAAGVTIIAISQRFIFAVAPSILGITNGSEAIAVFGTASVLEGYIWTATSVIGGLLLPKVSRMIARQPSGSIMALMIKVGRMQFFVAGLLFSGFIAVGLDFVRIWVGEIFSGVYVCVIVLVFPSLIGTTMQVADVALVASGRLRGKSVAYATMAIVSIGLMIPFSYYWGASGTAIAICTAYSVRTLIMCHVFHRELALDLGLFFKRTLVSVAPTYSVLLLLAVALWRFAPVFTWVEFAIKCAIFTVLYGTLIWLFSLNARERAMLFELYRRIVRTR